MKEIEPRIEHLSNLKAAYVHSSSKTPEEDAMTKILEWANANGLAAKSGVRLFGRNTYPKEKADVHGYEFYLALPDGIKVDGNVETAQIPDGSYAVLRFKDLQNIGFAWKKLWSWIEKNGHEHAGWQKTAHGWVNGFEEQVNWQERKPLTEWVFDLWVKLKE